MTVPGISSRRLGSLLEGLEAELSAGAGDLEISGVTCDSRAVEPGSLFIAMAGERFDGHDFVPAAAAAGAAAALVETPPPSPGIPFARVHDSRRAAGPVAAAFHGAPSDAMRLVGVTGTNGKTTVAWLLDAFFQQETSGGLYCGTVTHRAQANGRLLEPAAAGLTTREAPEFQSLLAVALSAGCRFGAVECSSHGLRQGRLGGDGLRSGGLHQSHPRPSRFSRRVRFATSGRSASCSRICYAPAGQPSLDGTTPSACGWRPSFRIFAPT